MTNPSIYAAFERMWQHIIAKIGLKADAHHTHDEYVTREEVEQMLINLYKNDTN